MSNKRLWYCVTFADGHIDEGFAGARELTAEDLERAREMFRECDDETKTGIAVFDDCPDAPFCIHEERGEEIEK